jgi:hypothetical protein
MARPRILAAFILGLIAVAQALRFALAWPVTINGFSVPVWASAIAAVVAGAVAVMLWRDGRR